MSPIHATKDGKRCRYISNRLKGSKRNGADGWRIAAEEIKAVVLHQVRTVLSDQVTLSGWIGEHASQSDVQRCLEKAKSMLARTDDDVRYQDRRAIIRVAFRKISLSSTVVSFDVDQTAIARWLTSTDEQTGGIGSAAPRGSIRKRVRQARSGRASAEVDSPEHIQTITVPIKLKRRRVETRFVIDNGTAPSRKPDQPLVDAIARGHAISMRSPTAPVATACRSPRCSVSMPQEVSRFLPLAFLSPHLADAILHGRQPADLSVRELVRGLELPLSWAEQASLLAV